MTIDKILIAIFSFIGIGFTYWFFLRKNEKEVVVTESSIDILVDGGYQPEVISIPKGKTTKLNFLRKDSSSCLEDVVISDFKVRKFLPLNQKVTVEIAPEKEGVFDISCGMNMFHGKIKVT